MKSLSKYCTFLACLLCVHAESPDPAMTGLRQSATDFVAAYNKKDAAALATMFTEQGEIIDDANVISGRKEIEARYKEIFAGDPRQIAIEVEEVRLVAPSVAIEEGVYHISDPTVENDPPRSTAYTAVMVKNQNGIWQIASVRDEEDVTDAEGQLADLEKVLAGEWTAEVEGVKVDFAFGWDPTGKFLLGEILTTKADAEPQKGTMRIGWNAAKKSIVSWVFDANGGVIEGVWTADEDGWQLRSEGTTAEGESITMSQNLTTEGKNALVWSSTHRVIDGEKAPDVSLRIVRQVPEPSEK